MKNRSALLLSLAVFLLVLAVPLLSGAGEMKKVAVLGWKVNSAEKMDFLKGALTDMFTSRIGSSGVEVARSDEVLKALSRFPAGEISDDAAEKVAGALGLDYAVYGSVTILGQSVSLDVRVLDVKKDRVATFFSRGKGLDSIIPMADELSVKVVDLVSPGKAAVRPAAKAGSAVTPSAPEAAPAPAAPAEKPAAPQAAPARVAEEKEAKPAPEERKPSGPEFWKSEPVKGHYHALASSDLDGDGLKELFLMKDNSITVAEIRDGKLVVKKEIAARSGTQFVAVGTIDSDGDGKGELYVSGVRTLGASSLFIEYTEGDYRIVSKNIPFLFRVVRVRGKKILLGQRFRDPDGFYGGIRILKRSGDNVRDTGGFEERLPASLDLYRFTIFNFNSRNEKEIDLVGLGTRGHIKVYRKKGRTWTEYWRSKERFGGTLNRVEFSSDTSGSETYRYLNIEGGLRHADTDGDGREELIVKSNRPGGIFKGYARIVRSFSGGRVLSLSWDGEFLTKNWMTREVNGYVADFVYDDVTGEGPRVVMLVVEGAGLLTSRPKSYIIVYRPGT